MNAQNQIANENLTVCIHKKGAMLWSIKDRDGYEYLWQGDPTYWEDRAPNLFPYVARLTDGKYRLEGKTYEMDIHGFAKDMIFNVQQDAKDRIVFFIEDTEKTYAQYPYRFRFEIEYRLERNQLFVDYRVKNNDNRTMHFGLGGHPGFNVPLEKGLEFHDYYLKFEDAECVHRVDFSEDCFVLGTETEFPLDENMYLRLDHRMFDEDAIVLKNVPRSVTLAADRGTKSIRVDYPDMPYLSLWHWPRTEAPYLCIEPWKSLPSRKDIIEDFAEQPDMVALDAGKVYHNEIVITMI